MKVIVCGAGQVGVNIARYLADLRHDVTVIDRSAKLIRKIQETIDVQALEGFASDPEMLDRAGAGDAELIIAVTLSDEVNMIACQVAHTLFKVPTKIARVRNRAYMLPAYRDLFTRDSLPIDVIISPEVEVAEAIFRRLQTPGAFDMLSYAEDKVRVVGVRLGSNCPVLATPLRHLTELFPDLRMRIMGIRREERVFFPTGDDHFEAGDSVYAALPKEKLQRGMDVLGHEEKAARRVIIVGGGNVGLTLAMKLEQEAPFVLAKLIDADERRAALAADRLENVVVLYGDALDTEVLSEANVKETETLIAVANDDEVNILSSLLAKRQGADRTITLLNNPIYGPLVGALGIDVLVDPRETTVSRVLQHVRRGRIKAVNSLWNGEAEILEMEIVKSSPLVGTPVIGGRMPKGVRVGAIYRRGRALAPDNDLNFEAEDRVIILALASAVQKVEQLFSVGLEFF